MPTATLNGTVIAEADEADVLHIEGNVVLPAVEREERVPRREPDPVHLPVEGRVPVLLGQVDGDDLLQDRAWSYPHPYPTAFDRVGKDFSNYVAFWKEVQVS